MNWLICLLFAFSLANQVHSDGVNDLAQQILDSKVYPSIHNITAATEFVHYLFKHAASQNTATDESVFPSLKAAKAFPCNSTGRQNPRPTSAQKLLPGDIDVVAAVGDSIVAAFGALSNSIFTVFKEWRGYSFSVGGQTPFETSVTVPNVLKKYNSALRGFSTGNGKETSATANLNVAVSGARSYNLLAQIDSLEAKFKKGYDIQNDWKLINLFIGGNDLCDYCSDTTKNSPANYQKNVEAALDAIKAKFPRTFVNLIPPPDVTLLGKVSSGLCSLLHAYECGCATNVGTHQIYARYVESLFAIQDLPKYKDQEDFFVVVQPFLIEIELPMKNGSPDTTYFAPDCFHFSGLAHDASAVALWNNMVEPQNKKKTWTPGEQIECPKPGQYLS
jgi:phospholipase B1